MTYTFHSGLMGIPDAIAVPVTAPVADKQLSSAKTQLIIGPPPKELWRIRSLRSIFTCDATPGDRVLAVAFTSAKLGDVWSMLAGIVAQGSQLIEVSGGSGAPVGAVEQKTADGGEGLTSVVNITWPDVWIPADVTLRLWMFTGIGPADTFSSVQALIERTTA